MTPAALLMIIAVLFVLCSFGIGSRMAHELRARGINAKPALVRWMIFKYMAEYKRVTLEETGRVGPLHQRYKTALVLAAIFATLSILLIVL